MIKGNSPTIGPVNRVVTVGDWDELRALLREYGIDRSAVDGPGVEQMLRELGDPPADL